jgi:hypothetical protein
LPEAKHLRALLASGVIRKRTQTVGITLQNKKMILYRPVGLYELQLIYESGLTAFPPRLLEQPIFYPILNIEYARQIAFNWNTKSEPFAGYVTEFEVDDGYVNQFERQIVGGRQHEELWIPAERLDEFNHHIAGKIKIADASFGENFIGFVGESTSLKGKDAITQFILTANTYDYNPMDVYLEIVVNKVAIYLNYPFWQKHDFTDNGIDEAKYQKTLAFIQRAWSRAFPEIQLGIA